MSESPFLPEHVQAEAPKKPPQGKKTFALWLVLIACFVVVWALVDVTKPRKAIHDPRPLCVSNPSIWTLWGPVFLVLFGLMVLLAVLVFRRYAASTAYNSQNEAALLAFAEHRLDDARRHFVNLIDTYKSKPVYRAHVRSSVATVLVRQGDLRGGLSALTDAEKEAGPLFSGGLRTALAYELAFVYALLNQTEAAAKWLHEAEQRLTKEATNRAYAASRLAISRAVFLCRAAEPNEAVNLLDRNWTVMRAVLNADWIRIAEVIRALAEAQGGQRAGNVVAARLLRVEPVLPGEFAFLGVAWPEMATFLGSYGIG